jgi:hypothetical protein
VPCLFGSSSWWAQRPLQEPEYPSYDAVSRGGVLSFSYPWSTKLTTTVGIRHADIHTSNVDLSVPPAIGWTTTTPRTFSPHDRSARQRPGANARILRGSRGAPGTVLTDPVLERERRPSYYFRFRRHRVRNVVPGRRDRADRRDE